MKKFRQVGQDYFKYDIFLWEKGRFGCDRDKTLQFVHRMIMVRYNNFDILPYLTYRNYIVIFILLLTKSGFSSVIL